MNSNKTALKKKRKMKRKRKRSNHFLLKLNQLPIKMAEVQTRAADLVSRR